MTNDEIKLELQVKGMREKIKKYIETSVNWVPGSRPMQQVIDHRADKNPYLSIYGEAT